jgi:hypothetical protein
MEIEKFSGIFFEASSSIGSNELAAMPRSGLAATRPVPAVMPRVFIKFLRF